MQVKKKQLDLDMKQQTGSKSGKEYIKAVHCHPAYWTSMQGTSCEMQGWMKHKLESRLLGEISITSDMQVKVKKTKRKWRGTKEPLDESKRGEWKVGLKLFKKFKKIKLSEKFFLRNLSIQKTKIMASGPIT